MEELNKIPNIEPKKNKSKLIIIVISIILVLAIGYIVEDKVVSPYFENKYQAYYQQGGLDIYLQFGDALSQCNQVPITLRNNQTVNAILVECLNQ